MVSDGTGCKFSERGKISPRQPVTTYHIQSINQFLACLQVIFDWLPNVSLGNCLKVDRKQPNYEEYTIRVI